MARQGRFIRLILLTTALSACSGTDTKPSQQGDILQCITRWDGDMDYAGSALTIRACLNAALCSDDLEMVLPDGVVEHYPDFDFWAGIYQMQSDETQLLGVQLWYLPRVAATLGDEDRPTLTVTDDAGNVMIDSVSQVPYETEYFDESGEERGSPSDPRTIMCKSVALNLDGSNRGFRPPAE